MKPLNRIYAACIIIVINLLLAACGGSGGNNDAAIEPKIPVANAITVTVGQDAAMDIDIGSEPGNELGDAPSTVTASDPANGSVTIAGNIITYTPDSDYIGTDTFSYTITDADAETATATVNITVLDTTAPTARIKFPASVALTQVNKVLVTGSASDSNTITRVTVAGTDATTTDGYANWRALVPLLPGDNTLLIETRDEFSNIDSAAASLRVAFNGPIMLNPQGITLDAANGRALVVDSILRAVVAVDLLTGVRTILSDEATPDTVNTFKFPQGITLDTASGRALVIDGSLNAVVAVDLVSGARTILSDNTTPDAINSFSYLRSITLDAVNDRALVVDSFIDNAAVVAVDLLTGARAILSDTSTPNATNSFSYPLGIVLDKKTSGRALVVDAGLGAVVAVDLLTGARTILSDDTTPDAATPFSYPQGITLDAANDSVLVLDGVLDAVIEVDLAKEGARRILSGADTPNTLNPFNTPQDIALDPSNDRALVVDNSLDAVLAVDLISGARTVLSGGGSTPNMANPFDYPQSIALDALNNRMLVADVDLFAVVAVDLITGARTILSDATTPDTANPFNNPQGITLDTANGRALVVDTGLGDAVVAVDLLTGARTILSDDATPGPANPFDEPLGITLDAANDRALVVDTGLVAVVAVDLLTGARTILSDASTPNTTNPLDEPLGITLDAANGRALVVDTGLDAVVAVDLLTGARTILSDDATPDTANPFDEPLGITLDVANNRALVVDAGLVAVVAVDLVSGARTVLSADITPIRANPFSGPQDIVLDAANGRALVVDHDLEAVIAVELTTGGRVIVSK